MCQDAFVRPCGVDCVGLGRAWVCGRRELWWSKAQGFPRGKEMTCFSKTVFCLDEGKVRTAVQDLGRVGDSTSLQVSTLHQLPGMSKKDTYSLLSMSLDSGPIFQLIG